jgi:hypothetical protein
MDHINDHLALPFAPDLLERKIEEATDVFCSDLECFEPFNVAFAKKVAKPNEVVLEA